MLFNSDTPLKYKEPLFRPPSEADSLVLQISYGCPHNKCLFCPMYKGVRHEIRPLTDILSEIDKVSLKRIETSRIFLADADVMDIEFSYLKSVFEKLNSCFPNLSRISMYANGSSINNKSAEELTVLKNLKLHTLYMGLESGDEKLLQLVKKDETADNMIKAVIKTQHSGIRMCVFALLGLGGKKYSEQHAINTAIAVNKMNPKFFAVLRFIKVPGLRMYEGYETITEYDSIQELYRIIEHLELSSTVFRADHTSIPIPISARFPKDKQTLLTYLSTLLKSSSLDKKSAGILPDSL
ncbi:MAG TPA: hypothetical protein DD381_06550 [Lentisphaeria bacterium]|nr:MAG: hypothetical protein A2X47_13230 [Lentisphaerae bacterium GWF2_38_69]HBM15985.1 hypothetical protein [Lentisphaeria bacterium]